MCREVGEGTTFATGDCQQEREDRSGEELKCGPVLPGSESWDGGSPRSGQVLPQVHCAQAFSHGSRAAGPHPSPGQAQRQQLSERDVAGRVGKAEKHCCRDGGGGAFGL